MEIGEKPEGMKMLEKINELEKENKKQERAIECFVDILNWVRTPARERGPYSLEHVVAHLEDELPKINSIYKKVW